MSTQAAASLPQGLHLNELQLVSGSAGAREIQPLHRELMTAVAVPPLSKGQVGAVEDLTAPVQARPKAHWRGLGEAWPGCMSHCKAGLPGAHLRPHRYIPPLHLPPHGPSSHSPVESYWREQRRAEVTAHLEGGRDNGAGSQQRLQTGHMAGSQSTRAIHQLSAKVGR